MCLWVFSGATCPGGATGFMLHIPMHVFLLLVAVFKIHPPIHPSFNLSTKDIESQWFGGAIPNCLWTKTG